MRRRGQTWIEWRIGVARRGPVFRDEAAMKRFAEGMAAIAAANWLIARSRTRRILMDGYVRMKKEGARR